jgi:protein TonB
MKKFLIVILICFAQNGFSQTEEPKRYISDAERAAFEENQIYNTAGIEVKPEFPGGQEALERFLKDNYKNPRKDLKGKVYTIFTIERDGSLSDIKILRDLGYGTGAEAIRILKKSPKWIPGKLKNKTVRVLYALPIVVN